MVFKRVLDDSYGQGTSSISFRRISAAVSRSFEAVFLSVSICAVAASSNFRLSASRVLASLSCEYR